MNKQKIIEDLRNDVSWLQNSISEISWDQMATCYAMSIICIASFACGLEEGRVANEVAIYKSVNCTI